MTNDKTHDDILNENFEEGDFDFNESDYIEEALDDPMLDDFDFDAGLEDDDFENDLLEEEGADEGGLDDFSGVEEKSKMSLNFNTIVIICAVIIGGLVMVMQLNKSSEKQQVTAGKVENFATALAMDGAFEGPGKIEEDQLQSVQLDGAENPDTEKGFLFDTDDVAPNIQNVENVVVEGVPPMPSPIVSDENTLAVIQKPTSPETIAIVEVEEMTGPRGPFDDGFSEEQMPDNLEDIFGAKNIAETSDGIVTESITELKQPDAVETVLGKQKTEIDKIKQIASNVKEQITDSKIQDNQLNAAAVPIMQDVSALLSRLDMITSRLEAAENKIASIEKTPIEKIKNHNQIDPAAVTMKAVLPKTSPKAVKQSQKKVVKKKAKAVSKAIWELRAAQPGKAWVSRRGSSDMQPVIVGDKLASIGRIHSIQYLNKQWIVSGQYGKITQK